MTRPAATGRRRDAPAGARKRRFGLMSRGSTAVEFALICLPFVGVALGILEFGRALYVRNNLSFAADRAARMVLIECYRIMTM